eukprot:5556836-Prymnesium_polylepis.1
MPGRPWLLQYPWCPSRGASRSAPARRGEAGAVAGSCFRSAAARSERARRPPAWAAGGEARQARPPAPQCERPLRPFFSLER